jgi:Fe-S cluster assembly ATP-binding protein
MLQIKNLSVSVNEGSKQILKNFSLSVKAGEVHAIMGPNGTGKSTLGNVLAGKDGYEITSGEVIFNGVDILSLEVEERAHLGLFLAFQYPIEIPGVSNANFLKASVNETRKAQGLEPLSAGDFLKKMREKMQLVEMKNDFISRSVNVGYSGGEKKRNEIFQMAMLEPKLAILDETDSGLDIDALKIVSNGVNALRNADNAFIIITHYQRLLDYIVPDFVHVMYDGKIVKSGDKSLALELEANGYEQFELTTV